MVLLSSMLYRNVYLLLFPHSALVQGQGWLCPTLRPRSQDGPEVAEGDGHHGLRRGEQEGRRHDEPDPDAVDASSRELRRHCCCCKWPILRE